MKKVPVRLGPLSLILTVITICLTILSILVFTTASADLRLAQKYADTVEKQYEMDVQGQRALYDFMREGSEGWEEEEESVFSKTISMEELSLRIKVQKAQDTMQVLEYRLSHSFEEDEAIHGLWDGN